MNETATPNGIERIGYSYTEAARALGYNYWTIQRLVARGKLKASAPDACGSRRIHRDEINRFLGK